MMRSLRWWIGAASALAPFAAAQFPPTPQGVTTKQVTGQPGVSISYKPTTVCETTAKAWAGYVHMPISYLHDVETSEPYSISMFFWYFQAREDPDNAPTGIYLAGGPGESSLYGATSDGGPCNINSDSNSTYENPFSMNQFVNMLYIDQPQGTGYSYDVLLKSVEDLLAGTITPFSAFGHDVPAENATSLYGVFPSQNPLHTANTTAISATILWKFAQIWFSEFPEHTTCNKRVSIWGNSYAGFYIPATAAYFQRQNLKIQSRAISGTIIELDTIGFTNGCIDILYQGEWYPQIAYQNPYDFQVISKASYEQALQDWSKPNGCRDLILECRELGNAYDPHEFGVNSTVNQLCVEATIDCFENVLNVYSAESIVGNRSQFDMAHRQPDPFPRSYPAGFFNRAWVQKDLGVPVNFTADSSVVANDFIVGTGDLIRRQGMKDVEYLLDTGVKVTLIYGDRDYRCPWLGVEKLSLAANWTGADEFRSAGYAYIHTNSSYEGGVVRQHGNLSFSRVFQAGHDAYAYQPETVFQIFNRALSDVDIATGTVSTSGAHNNYSSTGPSSSDGIKEKLPSPPPPPSCYLYSVGNTCTVDQYAALQNGTAEIVDFTVVRPAGGGGPIPGGSSGF